MLKRLRGLILCLTALATLSVGSVASAQTTDFITWVNSQLPANQFIGMVAESVSGGVAHTVSGGQLQPSKTVADTTKQRAYWYKDAPINYYGEVYSYDATTFSLVSETYPFLPASNLTANGGDIRKGRFRVFEQNSDPTKSRVLAPRTISPSWNLTNQAFTTRICGISDTGGSPTPLDGFWQRSSSSCPTEITVTDASVTVYTTPNFDIYYDAPVASDSASIGVANSTAVGNLPTLYDYVTVVNQIMQGGPPGYAYSRERFIFGYKSGVYYGLVRWDSSVSNSIADSTFTTTTRAVGLKILQTNSGNVDLSGFDDRGDRDHHVPAPPPTTLLSNCIANSNYRTISWDYKPGAELYNIRVDDLTTPWDPTSNGPNANASGDIVYDQHGINFNFPTIPGHTYAWWVHSNTGVIASDLTTGPIVSACSGSAVSPPGMPAGLVLSVAGDIVTMAWLPSATATEYAIRIDDLSDPWAGVSTSNDTVATVPANSFTRKIVPGHTYNWWVHAVNAAGMSNPTTGANFSYTNP